MKNIKWGIIGTGGIASKFAEGLKTLKNAELVAVSSRSIGSAERFANEFDVHHRHVGLEAFAADKDIDVVYIATPHPGHCRDTLTCLEAGKAVLCEKPFAMNSKEVKQMVDKAREKKVFLMEAMWSYFFPAMAKVRKLISSGAIGEVKLLQSNFCFHQEFDPKSRAYDPVLGGGALLDLGVYNIALAHMVFDKAPSEVSSQALMAKTGVDEMASIILKYDNDAMAVSTSAFNVTTDAFAYIHGTDGYIKIPKDFFYAKQVIFKTADDDETDIIFNNKGNGFNYEAEEVAKCLINGETESQLLPLDTSISIMKTMDQIRKQWALKYPMEK